jgi:hypothetical protein
MKLANFGDRKASLAPISAINDDRKPSTNKAWSGDAGEITAQLTEYSRVTFDKLDNELGTC